MATNSVVQDYPKVRVKLHGPGAPYTVVGPATKIKYGRHKDGDVFWIHAADQQANPEMFVRMAEGSNDAVREIPTSPEKVRAPVMPAPRPAAPPEPAEVDDVDIVDFDFVEEEEKPKPKKKTTSKKKSTTKRKTKSASSK